MVGNPSSVGKASILGPYDKVIGSIFGAVLVALLLWIGSTTHNNTVVLAELSANLQSFVERSKYEDERSERRTDKIEADQERVLRHLGKELQQ